MNSSKTSELRKLVINSLNEIQKELPTNQLVVEGVHIWPIIKIRLFFAAYRLFNIRESNDSEVIEVNNPSTKIGLLSKIAKKIKLFSLYLYLCYLQPKKRIDFMTSGVWAHRIFDNNKWTNRYFLGLKGKRIHFECSTLKNEQIDLHENTYITNELFFLHKQYFSKARPVKLEDNALLKQVIDLFNAKTKLEFSCHQFNYHVNEVLKWAEFWKKILNRIHPKEIRVLCYYGIEMHGLCIAGNSKSISVIDLQHGGQGSLHPAYNGFGTMPDKGYQVLPSHYSVWDVSSKSFLEFTGVVKKENILLEGNPWINYNIFRLKQVEKNHGKPTILYTLQTTVSVPKFMIETIKASVKEFKWVLKTHPRMTPQELLVIKGVLQDLINENMVEINSESNLLSLLQMAEMHVSGFSGSIQEAGLLGKPTIIIDRVGLETYHSLIQNQPHLYKYAETKEQFLEAVSKLSNN